jgi:hypothetical protein
VGTPVKQRYMSSVMCGRSTYKLTWEEIVRLYRLTADQRPIAEMAGVKARKQFARERR